MAFGVAIWKSIAALKIIKFQFSQTKFRKTRMFSGGWQNWSLSYLNGKALAGSTIGFYGMGRIGESAAEKVAAFHPEKIIYHNRKPKPNSRFM